MSSSSMAAFWRTISNLSGMEALLLGFLLLCAMAGALVAIYIGIRSFMDARRERRAGRSRNPQRG